MTKATDDWLEVTPTCWVRPAGALFGIGSGHTEMWHAWRLGTDDDPMDAAEKRWFLRRDEAMAWLEEWS